VLLGGIHRQRADLFLWGWLVKQHSRPKDLMQHRLDSNTERDNRARFLAPQLDPAAYEFCGSPSKLEHYPVPRPADVFYNQTVRSLASVQRMLADLEAAEQQQQQQSCSSQQAADTESARQT
jgi:hypothetical protein